MKLKGILLIALAFFLPISIFVTDVVVFSLAILWLVQGNLLLKWRKIKQSKWMLSLLILFVIYLLGMLWGTYHSQAAWVFQKSAILFLLPILYTFDFSDKQIKQSLYAFIASMTISSIIAILINLKWINYLFIYSDIFVKSWSNPAFMTYTDHNVFLAFSVLLCLKYVFHSPQSKGQIFPISTVVVLCLISLFTENGRAGQVAFILGASLYFVVAFWHKKQWLAISLFSLIAIVYLSYTYSTTFNSRIEATIMQSQQLGVENTNSLNTRYYLTKYTLEKLKEKPLLGFGTGSFIQEYTSVSEHAKSILEEDNHKTPHNNYLFIWFELGLIGLLTFIAIFYYQIKELYQQPLGKFRLIMPVMFLIIMLFDTYFQNHNSAVLYAYLSFVFTFYSFK